MRKLACGLLLGLAGCAAQGPMPAGVTAVRVEQRPGVTPPLAQGEARLVVRAVPAAAPAGQELVGAACTAASPYFTASFASPAVLLFPDYGSAAPQVTVTCRSGSASGTAVATPEATWSRGLGGWPAVGVSVGTGNNSGVGVGMGWYGGGTGVSTGAPVIRYRDLSVPVG
jgi:hypothetical protein